MSDDRWRVHPTPCRGAGDEWNLFIDSQPEPWVDVSPADGNNLVGMWQEECWSTAGVRNLVGTSMEGGQTWRNIRLQGVGIVAGGEFQNKNAGPLLRRPLDGRRSDPGTGLVPRGPKPVGVPGIRSGDGVPNATVDRQNGTIYAVWQDSRFSKGKRDDVLLIRSTDKGGRGRPRSR